MKATIKNNVHNTEARVKLLPTEHAGVYKISRETARRTFKKLCSDDCDCGGDLGQRGPNQVRVLNFDGKYFYIEMI